MFASTISAGTLQLSNLVAETTNTKLLSFNTTSQIVSYTSNYVRSITAGTNITITPTGPNANGDITIDASGGGGGTVTSVSGDGSNITVTNGTTTPVVTLAPDIIVTTISAGGTSYVGGVTFTNTALSGITTINSNSTVSVANINMRGNTNGNIWLCPDSSPQPTQSGGGCIAIGGSSTGKNQNTEAIAIGSAAGASGTGQQALGAIALGAYAGSNGQGQLAVAIGQGAVQTNGQGTKAIAIGYLAANGGQGQNSIAIGAGSGVSAQSSNCIVLNATGIDLATGANSYTNTSGFFVAPVRSSATSPILQTMMYDQLSKEIRRTPFYGGVFARGSIYWTGSSFLYHYLENVASIYDATNLFSQVTITFAVNAPDNNYSVITTPNAPSGWVTRCDYSNRTTSNFILNGNIGPGSGYNVDCDFVVISY